jgi:uncharacterized protein (DUF3084 family)
MANTKISQNKQLCEQLAIALSASLCSLCEKIEAKDKTIEAKDKTIEMLLTGMQNLENRMQNLEKKCATLDKRQSYLEFDLHSENENLKDEKLGLLQQYGISED